MMIFSAYRRHIWEVLKSATFGMPPASLGTGMMSQTREIPQAHRDNSWPEKKRGSPSGAEDQAGLYPVDQRNAFPFFCTAGEQLRSKPMLPTSQHAEDSKPFKRLLSGSSPISVRQVIRVLKSPTKIVASHSCLFKRVLAILKIRREDLRSTE